MASMAHGVDRIDGRRLVTPAFAGLIFLALCAYLVAFDQGTAGALISDRMLASGGVLHELFHDARHLIGVPCH